MLVCSLTRHPVLLQNKDHLEYTLIRESQLFLLPLFLFMGLGLKNRKTIMMYCLNSIDEVGRKSIENELSCWPKTFLKNFQASN